MRGPHQSLRWRHQSFGPADPQHPPRREVARAHPRIGYVHERPAFETRMSAVGYLTYLARLAGLWGAVNRARVGEVLARVDLAAVAGRRIGTFSKGMLQRLAIAQALLTDPDLLILDEPTSGLDPGGQWEVRQIIAGVRRQGKTLLLCSHYLPEVEDLCDAVGILRRGHLVRTGSVAELLRMEDAVELVLDGEQRAAEVVERLGLGALTLEAHGATLRQRAGAGAGRASRGRGGVALAQPRDPDARRCVCARDTPPTSAHDRASRGAWRASQR